MHVVSLNALASPSKPDGPAPEPNEVAEKLAAMCAHVANGRPAELEIDYVVKGLLTRGELSVLYGPSNCGKSTVATTLGTKVTRGERFAGMSTRRFAVLHVAPEGGRSVMAATTPHIGAGQPDDAEPYIVLPLRVDLRNREHVRILIALVNRLNQMLNCEIGLVLIDTYVLSIGDADENSSRDVTPSMFNAAHLAYEVRAHVMCLHHTNKGGELRGSSAILAASDATFELSPDKDAAERNIIKLRTVKQKSVSKGADIYFRLGSEVLGIDSEGDKRTTTMVEVLPQAAVFGSDGRKPSARTPANDPRRDAVLAAVTALSSDPAVAKSGFEASTIRDQCDRSAFASCCDNPGSFLKAVSRALEVLAELPEPRILKDGGRYRLVEQTRVAAA